MPELAQAAVGRALPADRDCRAEPDLHSELAEAAKKTRAWACYDCGKCTATCPISRAGGDYSPRRNVLATNQASGVGRRASGSGLEPVACSPKPEPALFTCLTCGLCDRRCPAEVRYTQLVQRLRELSFREGVEPECPHGGSLQSVMRMMAKGKAPQDRMGWLTDDLKIEPAKGEVFYWTGCTMYYDAFFPELEVKTLEGTRAAVRILNKLSVSPVVSPDERCCGHDLFWNGDRKSFELLAKHNVKLVTDSGAETLVVSCAECLRTWKVDYQPFFEGPAGGWPKIMHLSQYLAERADELKFKPSAVNRQPSAVGRALPADPNRDRKGATNQYRDGKGAAGGMLSRDEVAGKHVLSPGATCLPPPAAGEGVPPTRKGAASTTRKVTFQDPCRLGRHLGIYDPPRQMLDALPGVELVEMKHFGPSATCCAGGTWSNCDRYAKKVQVQRLREARATGAEVLATACPKCQVHFRCAMKDPKLGEEISIEMCDVAELVADAVK